MKLSDELVAELVALAGSSRIEAVALVRSQTGCKLDEAMNALAKLVPVERSTAELPWALYAFGVASPDTVRHHGPCFRSTALPPGRRQSVLVAEPVGAGEVTRLAEILGIEASDPNQHHLNLDRIDWAALAAEFVDTEELEALRRAGFSFHVVLRS